MNHVTSPATKAVLKLASRPQGTNCADIIANVEIARRVAAQVLSQMALRGTVYCSKGRRDGSVLCLNQYFVNPLHFHAWELLPEAQRPNIWRKVTRIDGKRIDRMRPLKSIQTTTWKRAPMIGSPIEVKKAKTVILTAKPDYRFKCSPEESAALKTTGYFSSGEYRK